MTTTDFETTTVLRARISALRGLVDELRNQLWAEQEMNKLLEKKIAALERDVQELAARQNIPG